MEEFSVDERYRRVARAGDDLHRRVDPGQQAGQHGQLGRVGTHVAHRLSHPVALVGGQVVLADRVGQRRRAHAAQGVGHQPPRIGAAQLLEVGGLDPVVQDTAELKRDGGRAAADQAAQPARIGGRGEQRDGGPGARPEQVQMAQAEGVGGAEDEPGHRLRGHERVTALGMTEPRQVDGHQAGLRGQPRPDRHEGQQTLRPRAEQQGVLAAVLAPGVPDGQPVDDPELHLEGRVQPGGHGTPFSRCPSDAHG